MQSNNELLSLVFEPKKHPLQGIEKTGVDITDFWWWVLSGSKEVQELGLKDFEQWCQKSIEQCEFEPFVLNIRGELGFELSLRYEQPPYNQPRQENVELLLSHKKAVVYLLTIRLSRLKNQGAEWRIERVIQNKGNWGAKPGMVKELGQWLMEYQKEHKCTDAVGASIWALNAQCYDIKTKTIDHQFWKIEYDHELLRRVCVNVQERFAVAKEGESVIYEWGCQKTENNNALYSAMISDTFKILFWPQKPIKHNAKKPMACANKVRLVDIKATGKRENKEKEGLLSLEQLSQAKVFNEDQKKVLGEEYYKVISSTFENNDIVLEDNTSGDLQCWLPETPWTEELIEQCKSVVQNARIKAAIKQIQTPKGVAIRVRGKL